MVTPLAMRAHVAIGLFGYTAQNGDVAAVIYQRSSICRLDNIATDPG
jgi:hypothetical protein